MPGAKKECPSCKKMVSAAHFARHQRTCKGEVRGDGKAHCPFCSKAMRSDNLNRHMDTCKMRGTAAAEDLETLKKQVMELMRMVGERDEQIRVRDDLIRVRDEQISKLTSQLAKRNTTNNYYAVFIDRMTPWCFNPSDPAYEAFVDAEVKELEDRMDRDKEIVPLVKGSANFDEQVTLRRNILYERAKELIECRRPNYLVPNLSRRLGFYVHKGGPVFDNQMWHLREFYGEVLERLGGNRCFKGWHRGMPDGLARYVRDPAARRAKTLRLQA